MLKGYCSHRLRERNLLVLAKAQEVRADIGEVEQWVVAALSLSGNPFKHQVSLLCG